MNAKGAGAPRPARILFAHNSSEIGGGNRVLLTLLDGLPRDRFGLFSLVPRRGPLEAELRSRGVRSLRWDTLSPLRSRSSLSQAAAVLGLALLLGWRRIDLLHANGPLSYRLPSLALSGAARLCHLHLAPPADAVRWAFQRRPGLVVACSEAVRAQAIAALGASAASSVLTLPNAIDLDHWSEPPPAAGLADLPRHDALVLFCGSLGEHKGLEDFLQLASRVLAVRPATLFVIAGDDLVGAGAHRRRLEQLTASMGLGDRVRFTGFVSDPRALVRAARIVVLPSKSEGMPVALLEAGACGKPVLAYRIPGVDEVVDDGVEGRLVALGDVQALTAAAIELLDDDQLAAAMGRRGRQRVETRHDARRYAARMTEIYDRLLRDAPASAGSERG